MKELLETYSIEEIILFITLLCAAIKGACSYFDWGVEKIRKVFDKNYEAKDKDKRISAKFDEVDKQLDTLRECFEKTSAQLAELHQSVSILLASDRDDIKAWITKEHHLFCYEKGWIDDYSLDCIERRYQHYINEGGNSYVADLMNDIRQLPMKPKNNN